MLEVEVYEYLQEKGIPYLYWRYGIRKEIAEDITHDAFIGVLLTIRKKTKIEDVKAYTNTVLKFTVLRWIEREKKDREKELVEKNRGLIKQGERELEEGLYEREKGEILDRSTKRLSSRERVVFESIMRGEKPRVGFKKCGMEKHAYECLKNRVKWKLKGFVEREIYGN